ncbi:class I SAM-dependent methyltransferase [Mesorhizobium sp. ZMM04-5]|uniref:Class I SAM-dependent methyltransferase n=1 Tax=Mesorhizobium marinum TaxID=3228790 RepID=A0ABV3QXP2_9HYPH
MIRLPGLRAPLNKGHLKAAVDFAQGKRPFRVVQPSNRIVRAPESPMPEESKAYWEQRKNSVYLQHVKALVSFIGRDQKTIIDVGSNACPCLDWFPWFDRRVSIDLNRPYAGPGIEGLQGDFFDFDPNERFDVAICLQVLEHIPDAKAFAQRLLRLSPRVLVSVPYKWKPDVRTGHVHDPVDEAKVEAWFGRKPDFMLVSTEIQHPISRLIAYYQR